MATFEDLGYKALPAAGSASGAPARNTSMVRELIEGSSPSYHALQDAGLLASQYMIRTPDDLDSWHANSDPLRKFVISPTLKRRRRHLSQNEYCCVRAGNSVAPARHCRHLSQNACCAGNSIAPCCCCCVASTEVNSGELGMLEDGRGNFAFLGPGLHCYLSSFYKMRGKASILDREILNGDRGIITIRQGYVGECEDRGQTLLLPPGMHQWHSATMRYIRSVDLDQPVLRMGPYTLVTVDEGYAGVTQENGRMVVLVGGRTYMLKHRNHKFETQVCGRAPFPTPTSRAGATSTCPALIPRCLAADLPAASSRSRSRQTRCRSSAPPLRTT